MKNYRYLFSIFCFTISVSHAGAQRWYYKSETTSYVICNDTIGIFKLIENNHLVADLENLPFKLSGAEIASNPNRSVLIQINKVNQAILLIDEQRQVHHLSPMVVQHGLCR